MNETRTGVIHVPVKQGSERKPSSNRRRLGVFLLGLVMTACVADTSSRVAHNPPPPPAAARLTAKLPPAPFDDVRPPQELVTAIRELGSSFDGKVGIAVRRIDTPWEVSWNGQMLMPQQSVSKLWVAMTLLDAVDRGVLKLEDKVTIRREDLTLFHQPIAQLVSREGYTTSYDNLLRRAMTESDNTDNDTLLRRVGGPEAVRSFLARRFISNVRFGPGERRMQSAAAGLEWRQELAYGRAFYEARARLPRETRERALDSYLANPPDGAAASGIATGLARLKRGEMLSRRSTDYLLEVMHKARTGPQRVKGGVPAGWSYAHKTGTGQELNGRATGFNDVGVMTAPDGASYAIAVMIGSTRRSIPARWELMQSVAKAVAANHRPRGI